ncbi:cation-transporting P-type ATPase [Roseibium aggregatum]|uniref:cation-translocating P-type ATPase n=1 Tax=Roseibium aggregatum TaxID=187304 RepID=UPI002E292EFD|nr:cation-transporting P-type ATPase [Roseibium aggregatum]
MTDRPALPENAHSLSGADVLEILDVSAPEGLSDPEVAESRARYGRNTIEMRKKVRPLIVLLHQVKSPVVYLLGAAALLALYFGEWSQGAAILVVLALNSAIGFGTEIKAARSIEALRTLGTRSARVRRNGQVRTVPAEDLVVGDIVLFEGGDGVSADIRLIEASNIGADESALTGESVAVDKSQEPVAADALVADRTSMLFKGTLVTRGSGTGVVVAVGAETELGRISRLAEEAQPEESPLEKGLAKLSGQLVWATLVLTALIAGTGILKGGDILLMVNSAIALSVAAIPEGLPVVATLTLARGMWRMARQNALIERLPAVEILGATTVILTDKTGTLTENRMAVRRLWVPAGELELDPMSGAADTKSPTLEDRPQFRQLAQVAVLCNNAALGENETDHSGDPMEQALLRLGDRTGLTQNALLDQHPRVCEHAFDASTKMMATVHEDGDGYLYAAKGAPEMVLRRAAFISTADGVSPMDDAARAVWLKRIETLGHQGLRVLACATKTGPTAEENPYDGLTFLGLIGLEDPARVDVPDAIRGCREAGMRVVMVTGDHAVTARSIARHVGLGSETSRMIDGPELSGLNKSDTGKLLETDIFSRVNPSEKLALVRAYQDAGEIVAMTGDGVNDAPALRQADIGIAMGLRGTDVARQAAAMILLDDAFPTIVKAVREGRIIFGNIRRFAAYLLSCNLSEVLVVGIAVLSNLPLPILALQILYLNLVTDVFPAFALALGEGEKDIMNQPPRPPKEPILGRDQWSAIVAQSLVLTAGTFGALFTAQYWLAPDPDALVTITFLTLAFSQLWHVFNMRHRKSGLFFNEVTRNGWIWGAIALCSLLLIVPAYVPAIADILQIVPPDRDMWLIILGMSAAPLAANQIGALLIAQVRR